MRGRHRSEIMNQPGIGEAAQPDSTQILTSLGHIAEEARKTALAAKREKQDEIRALLPTKEQLDTLAAGLCRRMTQKIEEDIAPIVEEMTMEMCNLARNGKSNFTPEIDMLLEDRFGRHNKCGYLLSTIQNTGDQTRKACADGGWERVFEFNRSQTESLIPDTVNRLMRDLEIKKESANSRFIVYVKRKESVQQIGTLDSSFEVSQDLFRYFCEESLVTPDIWDRQRYSRLLLFPFIASYFASFEQLTVKNRFIERSFRSGGSFASGYEYDKYLSAKLNIRW